MHLYLIGIDHKSSPIGAREALWRNRKAISDFWQRRAPAEAATLITCNRIEIYGLAGCADDAFGHISAFFRSFPDFSKYAYVKTGETQVFRHALRLASGLESQLNGEAEILSQLNAWKTDHVLPAGLRSLWEKAIILSKEIRRASDLGKVTVNIAELISEDIAERVRHKEMRRIVIIGTGKIAELFARRRSPGEHLTFVAHKHYQRAEALANYSGGWALPLQGLPRIIAKADVLISATASPHHVLKKEHFDGYPSRCEKALYVYDLAIPRDVDPAIGNIDGVSLYDLESLKYIFDRHNSSVRNCTELASDLIDNALWAHQEAIYEKSC